MRTLSFAPTGKATRLERSSDDGELEGHIPYSSTGWVPDVQARSDGGSSEKKDDVNKMDCGRGRPTKKEDGSLRGTRTKPNQSVCSDGGAPHRQEHRVPCLSNDSPGAPSDGGYELEKKPTPLSSAEELSTSIDEDHGEKRLNGMADVGRAKNLCRSKRHHKNSVPVLREGGNTGSLSTGVGKSSRAADGHLPGAGEEWQDEYDSDIKAEKSKSKSSPRTSASRVMALVKETIDTSLEAAAECLPSVTEEPVHRRCKTVDRRGDRECHTEGVKNAIEEHSKRTEQAKRLALEVARLRSSLRGSNYDLAVERKARRRLENDHREKVLAWENEREAIVSARHDAERALRTAQEELKEMRKQDEARCAKAKSEAAIGEASHRKAASALNGVIEVQDRLVRALRTEVDLIKRAKVVAQGDAREAGERLGLFVQGFQMWRDRAMLLEARMAELDHPQRQPNDYVDPGHSQNRPIQSALSGQNYVSMAKQAKGGERSLSMGRIVKWNDVECPESNRLVELDGEHARGSDDQDSSLGGGKCQRGMEGGRRCSLRDAVEALQDSDMVRRSDLADEDNLKDTRQLVDGNPLLLVSRGLGKATTEACSVGPTSPRSREHFERSMKAHQDISFRIENELAKARDELHSMYASDGKSSSSSSSNRNMIKKGATDATAAHDSQGDYKDPINSTCFDGHQKSEVGGVNVVEGSQEGDRCDGGNDPCADVKVSGPHLARVLAALLGAENTSRGVVASRGEGVRKHIPGKPDRRTTNGRGVGVGVKAVPSSPAPPCLRLSDYPSFVQAIFRGESSAASPPPAGVPKPPSDKASPALLRSQRGMNRRTTAAREKEGAASPVACGQSEGCEVTIEFRSYKPKSPLLQRWLAERCSTAPPNEKEE